jgi:hypothetical protein
LDDGDGMSDNLVQEIGTFSFDFFTVHGSEDLDRYHDLFLTALEKWLRAKGYSTAREQNIFYSHWDRRSDAIGIKRGLIDLYAKNNDYKVAVEFDNGKRLKFKSIEKLNDSDANILVGVVADGANDKCIKNNYQRYREVAIKNVSVNRDVWLIILSESRIELLSTPRNAPLDPKSTRSTEDDNGIGVKAFPGKNWHKQRLIEEY